MYVHLRYIRNHMHLREMKDLIIEACSSKDIKVLPDVHIRVPLVCINEIKDLIIEAYSSKDINVLPDVDIWVPPVCTKPTTASCITSPCS